MLRIRTEFDCGCIMESHASPDACPQCLEPTATSEVIADDNVQYLRPLFAFQARQGVQQDFDARVHAILDYVGEEIAYALFDLHEDGDIFAVPVETVYVVHGVLANIDKALGSDEIEHWLIEETDLLDGRSPMEALNAGDYAEVYRASSSIPS